MSAAVERTPTLDKYELLEELGHGGMATVYRAVDRRLGREVAVKVIHRHLRENEEVRSRFASEARAVAKLRHPNIVEVYDVSAPDELENYLVVELVRGRTLRELLREQRFLPAEIAAAIGIEIAAGLERAHQHGVIHRDVKPENVLVEEPAAQPPANGDERTSTPSLVARVKITDFGIAKMLDQQGVTSTGQVLGSPAHMAPEQIEGGAVSARSDVFGLGVLLYEAMVGRLPFDGQNPAQVLRRVLDGSFAAPDRCRPTIGGPLSAVVSKALSHCSEERYASVWELAEALRAELQAVGFGSPRQELSDFLADPDGYRAAYQQRMVELLVQQGRDARAASNSPAAAALFNRALAFRPDDPELLGEVAGMARRRRMRRAALRAMWLGVGLSLIGIGVFLAVELSAEPEPVATLRTESATSHWTPPRVVVRGSVPGPIRPAAAAKSRPTRPKRHLSTKNPRLIPARSSATPAAASTANSSEIPGKSVKVEVSIGGASGGKLRIDGQPKEWFTVIHELTPGPHTFEFIPPNETCCVVPKPRVEIIRADADMQKVRGYIEFREAKLRFAGQPGSLLRCGELFPGELPAAGERSIPMSKPLLRVSCTVIPEPSTAKPPTTIDVTLRPGGTLTIPGA